MENQNKSMHVPIAIVVAGLLIAGAVYFKGDTGNNVAGVGATGPTGPTEQQLAQIRPIATTDHIRGNVNAPVTILEYSDLECPFCQRFHETMNQVMAEYSANDQIRWVYRHFPLDIHPKAQAEAEAAECAYELGGDTAFWQYIDKVFEITPSNNGLDLALLPQIAADLGLDRAKFQECQTSGRHKDKVIADADNAIASGGTGTPFSLLIAGDQVIPLGGAVPYESLKTQIDALLARI